MSESRIQFNAIVASQLPAYVREDYPLVSDFLKQYYLGQEYQGGPIDLIQNIDNYIKLDNNTNNKSTDLSSITLIFVSTSVELYPNVE